MLIVFTLGVVVWLGRPGAQFPFRPYGLVAAVAIGTLAAGASLLIDRNQNLAIEARRTILRFDREAGAETDADEVEIAGGYIKMVALLAAAAILAILVSVDY